MIVDGHEQELPAGAVDRVAAITSDSMAGALDAPELLGVQVQQIAWRIVFVADHWFARLQVTQLRQSHAREHPADGTLGHTQSLSNTGLRQPLAAQFHDRQRFARLDLARAQSRFTGAVAQARLVRCQVAPQPLPSRSCTHPRRGRGRAGGETFNSHLQDHLESTGVGESGILMGVHSAGPLERTDCLAITSFSNPVRMDTNNLLEHHN